jgi:radical SAM superfamily enzyme YgiQ (UPF0313 family)
MVPDRLPEELRGLIKQFPAGSLQFEVGVQTWNPSVAYNVSRRQDYAKIEENFRFLRSETGVHSHADLIVGLPGENLESFALGFNALVKCDPDEVQVGILKRLKGTPISRHDQKFDMVYSEQPPFQLLKNKDMPYQQMQIMGRFAQYWDLYGNSGNFGRLMNFFKTEGVVRFKDSLFDLIYDFSEFLFGRHGQAHAISQSALVESAKVYLIERFKLDEVSATEMVRIVKSSEVVSVGATPKRQQKHLVKA